MMGSVPNAGLGAVENVVWFPKLKEVLSEVVFGKGFGGNEKAGELFLDTTLFTGDEVAWFDAFSALAMPSNESPERSAIDSDRAAWNEFVKPGIVTTPEFA